MPEIILNIVGISSFLLLAWVGGLALKSAVSEAIYRLNRPFKPPADVKWDGRP